MKTGTYIQNWLHRLGRDAGRVWLWLNQRDRQAVCWLTQRRLPVQLAKALTWFLKLLAIGAFLYAAFWGTMLFVFAVAAVRFIGNTGWDGDDEDQTEWRYGPAGYGLYASNGYRVDPHDPEDEHD